MTLCLNDCIHCYVKLCNIHCNKHVRNKFLFTDNKFNSFNSNQFVDHWSLSGPPSIGPVVHPVHALDPERHLVHRPHAGHQRDQAE